MSPAKPVTECFRYPTNGQGVRANDGNVTIHMLIQPAFQSGHLIVLNVDGEDGKSSNATSVLTMELENMSRGLYTVIATVVDKDVNDLIKMKPVSFNVLRVYESPVTLSLLFISQGL